MSPKHCACCDTPFTPRAQVPDQAYCSRPECQRERRQRWNREKLRTDPDYVDNKRRAQRVWLEQNPDYWRQYREKNPSYTDRNRRRQRSRTASGRYEDIAKRDASTSPCGLVAGIYRITPVESHPNRNAWTVEISPA